MASQTDIFAVEGMTCGSCAGRVEEALLKRREVSEAKVDLAGAQVRVTYAPDGDVESLFEAVREIGYEMKTLPEDSSPPVSRGLFGRLRRRRNS